MAAPIKPSQFYYVKSNNSLKACVTLMQEKGLSFLLIENSMGKLVGIFTLKDLLKHHSALNSTAGSDRGIHFFMSKPVITIPTHKMHLAQKIMIESGIRHLPVTSDRVGEENRILGVIDMESLLAHSLQEEKRKKYRAKDISVYSPNGSLLKLMKSAMNRYELIGVEKLWASKLKTEDHFEALARDYDLFFFDLNEERDLNLAIHFAPFLIKNMKRMICLASPDSFKGGQPRKNLDGLAKHSRVKVFFKPVDVHDIISECLS